MSTIRQSTIQSSKFHGHQGSVLCLDITDDGERAPFLLSGSEDKTARLWDLRDHRRRASLCIQAEGEVLSAAFAPSTPTQQQATTSLIALEGAFALDFTVYLSVENGVYGYDLRKASVPILKCPSTNLSPIPQNQDEVNQIQLAWCMHSQQQQQQQHQPHKNNNKRKGGSKHKTTSQKNNGNATLSSSQNSAIVSSSASMYLAAADDAGKVRFMDTNTIALDESSLPSLPTSQILHHDPNGVAVVPTCAFRPGSYSSRSLELASGGTDCKIHLWDILKPRKPIASYTIRPVMEEAEKETSKPQVCNPPMVYTLAWSPSGRLSNWKDEQ